MRVFPNSKRITVTVTDAKKLFSHLKEITEKRTGETFSNCHFIGDFDVNSFRIERKFNHFNSFRPEIKGRLQGQKLTLTIGIRSSVIVFLFVGYLLCGIAIVQSGSWVFLIGVILWSFVWYLMGWLFFTLDLKKTVQAVKELIIEKADEQQRV